MAPSNTKALSQAINGLLKGYRVFKRIKTHCSTHNLIVHYDTSAIKLFPTSVSLQHEPKASDVITLVKITFSA